MRFWHICVVCPLLAGCVGFAYPDVSRTPTVALPAADVHAFRVVSQLTMSGPWMTGPVQFGETVDEIPVTSGAVGPEREAYISYYYLVFPFNGSHSRTLTVLLYRPGYEIVEVPARPWWRAPGGGPPEEVAWKKAPDLTAEKAAVDRIASREGGRSPSKDVLRFAAEEYARLADSPAAPAAMKEELRRLAEECHDRAGTRAPPAQRR